MSAEKESLHNIRPMERKDLDQVMEIENVSFPSPWSLSAFERELKNPWSVAWVYELNGRVVGYLIAWKVADEFHIVNLAVAPQLRSQGIGERLLRYALENAEGCIWARLEVRRSNWIAQALYHKLGFQEIGIRKQYYIDENEDAIVMEKYLLEKGVNSCDVV